MGDSDLRYKAPPVISKFIHCWHALVALIIGPFGSGKSTGAVIKIMLVAQRQERARDGIRRTRIVVVRNTYRELMDTAKKTIEGWIPANVRTWVESTATFWIKFNDVECELMLRALDSAEDVKKLLSLDLTAAWVNEVRQIPRAVVEGLTGRVGRFPNSEAEGKCTWSGIFMDTNPPDSDHWIYKLFEEHENIEVEDRDQYVVFHQPSGLSPEAENIEHLLEGRRKADGRPLYYARMMVGKTKSWIDAFVRGQYSFVTDGRPVVPEFNDEIHTAAADLEWKGGLLHLGMDFGLTPALVVGERTPGIMQWRILDEITSDHMGAHRFAVHALQYLKSTYPNARFRGWGDPAGSAEAQTDETTPFEVVQAAGLPIEPAPTNDPIRRREAVVGPLTTLGMTGHPSLIISPKCKMLRRGMMGGYAYARVQVSGDDRFRDVPIKNKYSHVCEALQYLLVGEGMDHAALNDKVTQDEEEVRPRKVKTAIRRSAHGHGSR
jgi:hypothetical protein